MFAKYTSSALLFLVIVLASTPFAIAQGFEGQPTAISVLNITGSDNPRRVLRGVEDCVDRMGLELIPYSSMLGLIRSRGFTESDLKDRRVIVELGDRLGVDYFFNIEFFSSTHLEIDVFDAQTGRSFWRKGFRVSQRGLTPRQWDGLLDRIMREVNDARDSQARGRDSMEHASPRSADASTNGTIGPSFHVSVGTIALNRNFAASGRASIDNPLTGGIEYRLGFVPGFSLNGTVSPFSKRRGVGFAMGYERVFFRTKQRTLTVVAAQGNSEMTTETVSLLDSAYHNAYASIFYRHTNRSDIEFTGGLTGRMTQFSIDGNSEYRGVEYRELSLDAKGRIPMIHRILFLSLGGSVAPLVSLGDTSGELGKNDETLGLSGVLGLDLRLESGLGFGAEATYANYRSEVNGTGRDGRMIDTALDQYISLRFLAGFTY